MACCENDNFTNFKDCLRKEFGLPALEREAVSLGHLSVNKPRGSIVGALSGVWGK